MLHRQTRRRDAHHRAPQACVEDRLGTTVGQDGATGAQAGGDTRHVQEGGVLDDEKVRFLDLAATADGLIGDAHESGHRRPSPLGTEGGKGLGLPALVDGGGGQQIRGHDIALATPPMDSDFKHRKVDPSGCAARAKRVSL